MFVSTSASGTDNQEMGNNYYVRIDTYFLITGEILITLNGLRAQYHLRLHNSVLLFPHGPLSPIVRLVQDNQSVHEHAIFLNNKQLVHITLQHNNKVSATQLYLQLSVQ
jgi:hypothetical protein